MKIGLASYKFINNDTDYNFSQIEKAIVNSPNIDLLCFGESFLQGFDSLSWNYELDKNIAIEQYSDLMTKMELLSKKYHIDLLFGYFEKENTFIYSSCAVIIKGQLVYNYRRISIGWKEYSITDNHYNEGNEVLMFEYKGHHIVVSLCGDMWVCPDKFKNDDILIWPIYVNFSLEDWCTYEIEYAEQALSVCKNTLMINSLSDEPKSHGGAFHFVDGQTKSKIAYDKEDILIIDVDSKI